eukprot:Nitzschia sp. Nitz4//scaffold58_size112336//74124//75497//NITZ4_004042-RA/size112336-processed-gene-0.91-mRNA-1//-1//CDS//3329555016//2428//frame0
MSSIRSSGLVIAAGTYDGVLAGWELAEKKKSGGLQLVFATAVHTGSIRSLGIATSPNKQDPGSLLSCGYDETLRTHDWHKRLTGSGEIRTPADFGTPTCSAFAPTEQQSTHCVVGFSSGKVAIYKKRDWSVQHVLPGHDGGVGSVSVHPSGKLALSGGSSDGKLKLWDLTKGRLAFVNKINPASVHAGKTRYEDVSSLIWSKDGSFYALSYGTHITVREVATGKDVLDVDLPSRVNQVALMEGDEGLFVVAACNDGSLPVLAVDDSDDENRRAIMAIEPVDSHLAREERFKCVVSVRGFYVVTANSAGVVSLMNLEGAVKMIMAPSNDGDNEDDESEDNENGSESDDEEDMDLAVEIVESVQLGTGARITCLTAWCSPYPEQLEESADSEDEEEHDDEASDPGQTGEPEPTKKRKGGPTEVTMDAEAVKKARSLVAQAKSLQQSKDRKKKKKSKKSR